MYSSTNTVSSIYWDIVKDQLDRHFPALHLNYRSSRIAFIDLESIVHVKTPVAAGIDSMRQSLTKVGINLPDNIVDIIIHSETPLRDCKEIREQIKAKKLTEEEKGEILFQATAAIHSQRVQDDSIGKGFARIDISSRYIYMPIELIGFDNAREDYAFVKGIADALALRTHEYYIRDAYKQAKVKFYEEYAIYSPLYEAIERAILCLPPINTDISQQLNNDKNLRHAIVRQVLQQ